MPLQFPTIAEQVAQEFRESKRTISIATLAKKRGADVDRKWPKTIYTFDDDTQLIVEGRGKAHKFYTELP